MIATFTIGSVLFEISGTPEECRQFIGYAKTGNPRWWETPSIPKTCDPFKSHFGSCGAENCPIGPNGRTKKKPDTSANPVCSKCNDTGAQWSIDNMNWTPGRSPVARFMRECNGVH